MNKLYRRKLIIKAKIVETFHCLFIGSYHILE